MAPKNKNAAVKKKNEKKNKEKAALAAKEALQRKKAAEAAVNNAANEKKNKDVLSKEEKKKEKERLKEKKEKEKREQWQKERQEKIQELKARKRKAKLKDKQAKEDAQKSLFEKGKKNKKEKNNAGRALAPAAKELLVDKKEKPEKPVKSEPQKPPKPAKPARSKENAGRALAPAEEEPESPADWNDATVVGDDYYSESEEFDAEQELARAIDEAHAAENDELTDLQTAPEIMETNAGQLFLYVADVPAAAENDILTVPKETITEITEPEEPEKPETEQETVEAETEEADTQELTPAEAEEKKTVPVPAKNPLAELVLAHLNAPAEEPAEEKEAVPAAPEISEAKRVFAHTSAKSQNKPEKIKKPKIEKPLKPIIEKKQIDEAIKKASAVINSTFLFAKNKVQKLPKRTKKIIIITTASVAVLLGIFFVVSAATYHVPDSAVPIYAGLKEEAVNVRSIEVNLKDQLAKAAATKAGGNKHAFKFFANSELTIDEWYDDVPIVLGNVASNKCDFLVTILDKDNKILYRSMGLAPGSYLPSIKLFDTMNYGTYNLMIVVAAYNQKTFKNIGVQYMKLKLVIGIEQTTEQTTKQQ